MKILYFTHRGEQFKVKPNGDLLQVNNTYNAWDSSWIFLGVSKHHWRRNIDIGIKEAFKNPKSIIGGIVWDIDHGTTRTWGGSYHGKIPRITNAYIERSDANINSPAS